MQTSIQQGVVMAMTWRGVMAPLGQKDGIGRRIPIRNVDTDSRKMPLPFRYRPADFGGHHGSVPIGTVDRAWIEGDKLWGEGRFDDEDETARTVFSKIRRKFLRHISVDLEPGTNKLMAATVLDVPAFEDAEVMTISDDSEESDPERRVALESVTFAVASSDDDHLEWDTLDDDRPDEPEDVDDQDDEYDLTAFSVAAEAAYQQYLLSPLAEVSDEEVQFANWISRMNEHLPRYVKRIAKHLQRKGFTESHSIATAINAVRKACRTGDLNWPGVQIENPGSRAEACAALAQWEALKAKAKAR